MNEQQFDLIFIRRPHFPHQARQAAFQKVAESLGRDQSLALLFGRIYNDPVRRAGKLYHFNLRITPADTTGLHCVAPEILADQLKAGDTVLLLAELFPRLSGKGPNPLSHVVFVAVTDREV